MYCIALLVTVLCAEYFPGPGNTTCRVPFTPVHSRFALRLPCTTAIVRSAHRTTPQRICACQGHCAVYCIALLVTVLCAEHFPGPLIPNVLHFPSFTVASPRIRRGRQPDNGTDNGALPDVLASSSPGHQTPGSAGTCLPVTTAVVAPPCPPPDALNITRPPYQVPVHHRPGTAVPQDGNGAFPEGQNNTGGRSADNEETSQHEAKR